MFWDKDTYKEVPNSRLRVEDGFGHAVTRLNELEYAYGYIWANIWCVRLRREGVCGEWLGGWGRSWVKGWVEVGLCVSVHCGGWGVFEGLGGTCTVSLTASYNKPDTTGWPTTSCRSTPRPAR